MTARRLKGDQQPKVHNAAINGATKATERPLTADGLSSRILRIDAESCPVVHAHSVLLTRAGNGRARVILF